MNGIRRATVVGAGIGGMATALLLARTGVDVVLLERVERIAAVGAGLLLQPNGLAVLGGLGLDGPLRASGHAVGATAIRRADGAAIGTFRAPDFGPGLDRMLVVRRSALHDVLLAAVRAEPGVELRLAAEVTGAGGRGTVTVRPDQPTAADLVVGCDGVASAVRGSGCFGARVRSTGAVYLRGLVPRPQEALSGEFWTPYGIFGGAPVDDTTQYFYASVTAPPVRAAVLARDSRALRRAWVSTLPAAAPVLDAVERFDDLLVTGVVRVDCARWHDGRRVLVGDAAHAMSPTAGQGANSALVDAAVLVAEVRAAGSPADALAAYTARRRPAVRRVQDQADRLARVAHLRGRLPRRLRDTAFRALDRRSALAGRAARALQQEDPVALRALVRSLAGET